MEIRDIRKEYLQKGLTEEEAGRDPLNLFQRWFQSALQAEGEEANMMALATATADGQPSARMILLKGFGKEGFVFYTNYEGSKAQELEANPRAALLLHWRSQARQVRIEGKVERAPAELSDEYFRSRPRLSQMAAVVSPQSREIESRKVLERMLEKLEQQYGQESIPRPDFWGGYRVIPDRLEFWQGRPGRLHDRLDYRLQPDGSWSRRRLAP